MLTYFILLRYRLIQYSDAIIKLENELEKLPKGY